ncbi:MAG: RNA polymerase sigma-70 factor [Chryseobacterium sp.]|nr:MAG: RNA polymerase sigma-70 factor [Chryseobacterium sp.]
MSKYSAFSDQELTDLMKSDDKAAFTELYDRHWKALFRTANNIIQYEEAAQDAVQEVFISLWNRRAETEINSIKSYLHQATRFAVLKAIRAQKTDALFYERLRDSTTELIIEEPLLFKEQQALLEQLVASLPEDCKETFRLSREEQLTYKQIAAQLDISEKTVEKRMTKSLKFLREKLSLELCISILMLGHHFK